MNIKKHKELLDFMTSKSSYKGFINYCILVRVLKKFNCYDEFLDNVEIETLEIDNNFETNAQVLIFSFPWYASRRGDTFWRMVNIIFIALMISDEECRDNLHYTYRFTFLNEFKYLSFIYYFGLEQCERIFEVLNSTSFYFSFSTNRLKNLYKKDIEIINKMKDLKFKNDKELEKFLNSNGIF